jgi:hypothetical protein
MRVHNAQTPPGSTVASDTLAVGKLWVVQFFHRREGTQRVRVRLIIPKKEK